MPPGKKSVLIKCLLFAFFNTAFLLFFSLGRYNFQLFKDEEANIMAFLSGSRIFFQEREKPSADSILFINTNNSLKQYAGNNNELLTDRSAISSFLNKINPSNDSFSFIFFDILLEDPTSDDSLLAKASAALQQKIIFVRSSQNAATPLLSQIACYPASFKNSGGRQLHFPLYKKNPGRSAVAEISAPLAMYLYKHPGITASLPLYLDDFFIRIDEHLHFVNPVTEPFLNMEDVDISTPGRQNGKQPFYKIYDLAQINQMSNPEVNNLINGKMILVGDIDVLENNHSDMHNSLLENSKGILVLFNTFQMIEKGFTKLNYTWLFLFSLFLWTVSLWVIGKNYYGVFGQKEKKNSLSPPTNTRSALWKRVMVNTRYSTRITGTWKFIRRFLSLGLLFFTVSALSYFLFNVHLEIVWTAILLSLESSFFLFLRKKTSHAPL